MVPELDQVAAEPIVWYGDNWTLVVQESAYAKHIPAIVVVEAFGDSVW